MKAPTAEAIADMLTILRILDTWYRDSASGPHAGSLLFDDEMTFHQHICAALVKAEPHLHP